MNIRDTIHYQSHSAVIHFFADIHIQEPGHFLICSYKMLILGNYLNFVACHNLQQEGDRTIGACADTQACGNLKSLEILEKFAIDKHV
jgi:hypothetical protein